MAWKRKMAQLHSRKVLAIYKSHRRMKTKRLNRIKQGHANYTFIVDRKFSDCRNFFGAGLAKFLGKPFYYNSLVDYFAQRFKDSKKPVEIIEDGAGRGFFLAGLKKELVSKGIRSRVTALNFVKEALSPENAAVIDAVVTGDAAHFVPEKPADVIFSVFGSIHYSIPPAAKNHLLKFAYSLKKGGLLLAGFDFSDGLFSNTVTDFPKLKNLLAKNAFLSQRHGIIRSFEKRGFNAKFIMTSEIMPALAVADSFVGLFPDVLLVLERQK